MPYSITRIIILINFILITELFFYSVVFASAINDITCETVTNGHFQSGISDWDYWQGNSGDGSFSVINEEGVIDITNGGTSTADIRFRQFGHEFENGKSYVISFKAKASSPRTIEVKARLNVSPFTNYHSEVITLTTGFSTYSFQFTMNDPTDLDGRISFFLGADNADVTLDDISLIELGCVELNMCETISNGCFTLGTSDWDYWQGNNGDGSFSVINEEGTITIINGGTSKADIRFRQFGHEFENGKTYAISFKARASSPRTIEVRARRNVAPWTSYHTELINLTSSFSTFSFQFGMNDPTDLDGRLSFYLGADNAHVTLDDISLTEVGCGTNQVNSCETISNGSFVFGTISWDYWQENGIDGSFSVENEEGVISINNGGTSSRDIRFRQFDNVFENGKSYAVSFKAKASSSRTIEVLARQSESPWTNYHTEVINLTTSFSTISFQFVMNDPTDFAGRLSFFLGGDDADVTLDDISLIEVGCTSIPVNHPVIMGDESQYASLRLKSNQFPFSNMKTQAISDANNNTWLASQYHSRNNYADYCLRLKDIMNACALGYILDPANKTFYATKTTNQLRDALPFLIEERPDGWSGNVPLGAGIFSSILALDIMYDDIPISDRSIIENQINTIANALSSNWTPSRQAIKGIWALYNGNQSIFNKMVEQHDNELLDQFSSDGVFYPGTGYAFARLLGDDRNQKHLFLDILEHRGLNNYYSHPKLAKGHEWLWGYASTPYKRTFPFGDTSPTSYASRWSSRAGSYRAINFGQNHMEYANYLLQSDSPRPNLILYVVLDENSYDPNQESQGQSKLFPDGGAWFREADYNEDILSGALWNVKNDAGHQHFEANAISLAAYGELMLTNAGYDGWGSGQGSYSWTDIHSRAVTGNTVLIDYPLSNSITGNFPETNNHVQKTGAGIVEGLTTDKLDYACGDSGNALPNGQHMRNFMFIHPSGNTPGYWILMDDISTSGTNSTGHLALHPYSENVTTVASNKEYRWAINQFSNSTSYLSIHLAHQPDNLQLLKGLSADWDGGVIHDYMYSTYNLGSTGHREIITLLFPHENASSSPNTSRINTSDYTGMIADLGNDIEDHILESTRPDQQVDYANHSFTGVMTAFRTTATDTDWYFVKRGTSFSSGSAGFNSTSPISLFMDGESGQVSSASGTNLTLFLQELTCAQVLLNDQVVSSANSNSMISFSVPAGTYDILIKDIAENDFITGIIPDDLYRDKQTIESDGTVPANGNVTFEASQSISLISGFTVESTAVFVAEIVSCN